MALLWGPKKLGFGKPWGAQWVMMGKLRIFILLLILLHKYMVVTVLLEFCQNIHSVPRWKALKLTLLSRLVPHSNDDSFQIKTLTKDN